MATHHNVGAAASGQVTPKSDEAPAGSAAQGFKGKDKADGSIVPAHTPAVRFLEVAHDEGCPGRYTDGEGCACNPTLTVHTDPRRFMRGEAVNRAARRKAAREAAKVLRRAARKGGTA